MPGEVSPRADRETQKSGLYFTDHSLTGQSTSFLHYWLTFHNHTELFFTDRTLTDAFRLRESDAATRRPRVGLSGAGRCSQDARHLYFTDHALTGKKNLFAFGAGSHQRGESSLAAPSPNLFYRLHFDWYVGELGPVRIFHSTGQSLRTGRTNFFLPIPL
jgi:hypothetical protein